MQLFIFTLPEIAIKPPQAWLWVVMAGKPPGYRSVIRIQEPSDINTQKQIFCKKVHGEWRITANQHDSQYTFEIQLPSEYLVQSFCDDPIQKFKVWNGQDLTRTLGMLLLLYGNGVAAFQKNMAT